MPKHIITFMSSEKHRRRVQGTKSVERNHPICAADLVTFSLQGIEVRRLVAATTNGSVREHGSGGERRRATSGRRFRLRLDQPAK